MSNDDRQGIDQAIRRALDRRADVYDGCAMPQPPGGDRELDRAARPEDARALGLSEGATYREVVDRLRTLAENEAAETETSLALLGEGEPIGDE